MKQKDLLKILIIKLLLISTLVSAQTINTITGKVVNSKNELLMGNAVALAVKDSSFIKGVSFFDEPFALSDLNHDEVLIKLTSLKFKDTIFHVKYGANSKIDLGKIMIRSATVDLDEVRVVSKAPLFRNKSNGTVEVNVANTILATSTSVNEILSRSPNVIVAENGVSVFGKGEAIIYLNGVQITGERLAAISAAQIKKIEIISNPSSKYDAEGKAVINVITVANFEEGYKGSVNQYYTVSDFSSPSSNTNLNLNYKKNKLSLVGAYGLLLGETREVLHTSRERPKEIDNFKSKLETDWEREYKNFSNYTLGGQYDFNEKQYVSVEYSGYSNSLGGTTKSQNGITSNTTDGNFKSKIDNDVMTVNNSISANYNAKIDSLGTSFFAGMQYSLFDSETDDFINENNILNGQQSYRSLNNKINHKINVFSTQVDYTKAFNTKSKLDFGAKFSNVGNKSVSDFYVSENGDPFAPDDELSNDFKYEEIITAAYVNFSGEINEKTNYGAGLRSEYTKYDLNTIIQKEEDYVYLFPSAYLNMKVSDKVQLRASYSSRITRPRYQALNPSIIYQDAFTTIEGNPYLKPERTHSFEMSASVSKYNFKAGYNYTVNPISAVALEGRNPNSYVLQTVNLSTLNSYFASVSIPYSNDWWTSMNTVNVSYDKLASDNVVFSLKESKPLYYFYSSNQFDIKKVLKIQLLGWYLGDKNDGLYYRKNRSVITLGVEKNFLNQALKVKLMANDIFHKDKSAGNYEVGKTVVEFDRTFNTDYYRLILTYNFGKLKKVNYDNTSSGEAESDRAR
ncbi:TonB-dependent receptor [Flavobacterium sp. Fl-318]|uniref:TonB-dependent receptor n=1 Tax=Flavobacterium cupriresistens TaxID=2893885 RepID=A0ABU4R693_9FLAO|nr:MULTISPECIES: outer membrane beta-barrel family protein [unclassified Flavobacterium]MDX6188106.1 TonB-dependent receptor [Flavobacterium sp. Fl-318]UFH41973.1 TonB-dependent receptor [Flavobacterium sp. F-323]